ncbi:MAG: aspartate 1-decarboxylase [Flavobacteriaceae bacterium]|nr:aspartate 1-decarboxylase [Flavobacteriaceae bacterium]
MLVQVFKSKIHRIRVTGAELNYIGSITLDADLIDAAGIIVGERVQIVNINNGERFETYVIKGSRGSGEVTLNGPAARRVAKGDLIIVIAYGFMTVDEARDFQPKIVFPNEETNLLM